jgi:hypothetical protein
MFTLRGEVRQPVDLLVAEIVVDSRLYPGGYDVNLGSRIRRNAKFITLPAPGQALGSEEKDKVLPLAVTIHAMPSSPLHSSGLHEDRPPRHLAEVDASYGAVSWFNAARPFDRRDQDSPTETGMVG